MVASTARSEADGTAPGGAVRGRREQGKGKRKKEKKKNKKKKKKKEGTQVREHQRQ